MSNEVTLKHRVAIIIDRFSPRAADRFNRSFFHPERGNSNPDLEIRDLNSFWRRELGCLSVDTISAREALIDDVPADVWLQHFELEVAPTIAEHWTIGG